MIDKHRLNAAASHTVKGSHMIYFGAAALGAHSVYATAAGVIFAVMLLAMFFHMELEL